MLKRTRKQIGFGLLYLAILAAGIALIVLAVQPEPVAVPTPTPDAGYSPIIVEESAVIRTGQESYDVIARLRNPNARAGVTSYAVEFSVREAETDRELLRQSKETYLLPGSVQYVVLAGVRTRAQVGRVEVELPRDISFIDLPQTVPLPRLSTFLRDRTKQLLGDRTVETQRGVVTNNSAFTYQRVDIVAIARRGDGAIVGAGQTFAGELQIGEQREFAIPLPVLPTDTERVQVVATTNIFADENIVPIIGDPKLLR